MNLGRKQKYKYHGKITAIFDDDTTAVLTYEDCERLISYIDTKIEQVKKKESLKLSL